MHTHTCTHTDLGVAHVCDASQASASDALLPWLMGRRVEALAVVTTSLLADAHPLILRAVLVGLWLRREKVPWL